MNDEIMAEEMKPQTTVAFANRKYSNEEKRKMEEEELNELIAEQNSETKTEEVEAEPANAEERSFKKRYGDLRRHMQEKEKTWDDKFKNIERQLKESTVQTIKLPKSDEDIDAWANWSPKR